MYIFSKDDGKFRGWSAALSELGVENAAVAGSPLKAPIAVVRAFLSGRGVDGYVFRYLNDYPSFARTLVRMFSEWLVVVLVSIARGHVYWIAHNVDRESLRHHPRLSGLRRRFVTRRARCIFVTDPLLVPYAQARLAGAKQISWMCFGRPARSGEGRGTARVAGALQQLRQRLAERYPERAVYVGLCISAPSSKCRHFLSACDFVDRFSCAESAIGVVVVGAVHTIDAGEFRAAARAMRSHEHIELIDEAVDVSESSLTDDFDFFYRAVNDLSVSYTVYVAADVRKPLIVEPGTFLAELVEHYGLGGVAAEQASADTDDWLGVQIENWGPDRADAFLELRSWRIAAEQFGDAVGRGPQPQS